MRWIKFLYVSYAKVPALNLPSRSRVQALSTVFIVLLIVYIASTVGDLLAARYTLIKALANSWSTYWKKEWYTIRNKGATMG